MERASWAAAGAHRGRRGPWPRSRQRLARLLQQLGIADDGGERRAQLIGDIADEIALQPLGVGQGLGAVGQRLLQLAAWR